MTRNLVFVMLAACGGGGTSPPDPDAPVIPPGTSVVFLNFEGVTLTPGPDDATNDVSTIIDGSRTLSAFMNDQADRDARIAAVVDDFEAVVAPFDITAVTSRPASGPYDMIVFTGLSQEAGLSANIGAVAFIDCNDEAPSQIVFIFSDLFGAAAPVFVHSTLAVGGLGIVHGVVSSDKADDCMCFAGNTCNPTARCTFGGPGTPVATNDQCANGATTTDPLAGFTAAFGLAR